MKQYKLICQYVGGSFAAELNTPTSDKDLRGVYLTTDLGQVVGLRTGQNGTGPVVTTADNESDVAYYELRHFLNMLSSGNSNAMEILFNNTWLIKSAVMDTIQKKKQYIVNPTAVYNSTKGYSKSEYNLAVGTRTGQLGGKRQMQVAQYGYSPKNFANLLKLVTQAKIFFETGVYHLSLKQVAPFTHALLKEIREHPERFTVDSLTAKYKDLLDLYEASWLANKENICQQYQYSEETAARLTASCYLPIIQEELHSSIFLRVWHWLEIFALFFPK